MCKYDVYIYGAGAECRKLLTFLPKYKNFLNVKGIVTTHKNEQRYMAGYELFAVDDLKTFDFIIVSVVKWQEIVEILHDKGIEDKKIILGALFYSKNFDFNSYISERDDNFILSDLFYYKDKEIYEKEYLKEAVLHYPPRHITIGVTSACKNKCIFCSYHGEEFKETSNVYGLPFMLSLEDFKRMVDMAYQGGVHKIHVCGTGEPFANPQILNMLDYAIAKYGKVSFQTEFWPDLFKKNNYLEEICKRQKGIDSITTDIISADEALHSRIKKGTSLIELIGALKYISENSNIVLRINMILTHENAEKITKIIDLFLGNGITNFRLDICNLFSYEECSFASSDNVYVSNDIEITKELLEVVDYGRNKGIEVNIPSPADKTNEMCKIFWQKFQTWPVKGCKQERYGENMVPVACAAVVNGDLNSLGYLFDYDNIMDAWNSPKLVEIRTNLLKGIYPSEYCKNCYLYHKVDVIYKSRNI